jgi:hypothetical protein
MNEASEKHCCARFEPAPWNDKDIAWEGKLFVKDRVRSFLHIPLNFASVMKRNMAIIEAAGANAEPTMVLSDENSLWGADIYIAVSKEVPSAQNANLTGTFHSKVFEGPYKNMGRWVGEMTQWVASKGQTIRKLYCYYTTCPKCARAYGKNYVVLLAQV